MQHGLALAMNPAHGCPVHSGPRWAPLLSQHPHHHQALHSPQEDVCLQLCAALTLHRQAQEPGLQVGPITTRHGLPSSELQWPHPAGRPGPETGRKRQFPMHDPETPQLPPQDPRLGGAGTALAGRAWQRGEPSTPGTACHSEPIFVDATHKHRSPRACSALEKAPVLGW